MILYKRVYLCDDNTSLMEARVQLFKFIICYHLNLKIIVAPFWFIIISLVFFYIQLKHSSETSLSIYITACSKDSTSYQRKRNLTIYKRDNNLSVIIRKRNYTERLAIYNDKYH